MNKVRTPYATIGVPADVREKLKQIAKATGKFQSEILSELVERKHASVKKFLQKVK